MAALPLCLEPLAWRRAQVLVCQAQQVVRFQALALLPEPSAGRLACQAALECPLAARRALAWRVGSHSGHQWDRVQACQAPVQ